MNVKIFKLFFLIQGPKDFFLSPCGPTGPERTETKKEERLDSAAAGAIYLANPCLVIGNFIIFLETSQSTGEWSAERRGHQEGKLEESLGCSLWGRWICSFWGPHRTRWKMHTSKIHRHKKGESDLEAYQIVIVGNRRLIYHGKTRGRRQVSRASTPTSFSMPRDNADEKVMSRDFRQGN